MCFLFCSSSADLHIKGDICVSPDLINILVHSVHLYDSLFRDDEQMQKCLQLSLEISNGQYILQTQCWMLWCMQNMHGRQST